MGRWHPRPPSRPQALTGLMSSCRVPTTRSGGGPTPPEMAGSGSRSAGRWPPGLWSLLGLMSLCGAQMMRSGGPLSGEAAGSGSGSAGGGFHCSSA